MSKCAIPFLITLFLVIFLNDSFAQRPGVTESVENRFWFDMMQDPNANFYETQKAFYKFFENRDKGRGTGYKIFKRWEYINQPRILPDGIRRPPDYVANTYNEYKKNHASSRSASGTWSLVGPSAYPNNSTSQPTGMGRINAIAFHPTNADIIFVGAPSGGFWKTINGGDSWTNLTSNLPTLGVSSILIHPTDPSIIYLGSGDRDADDAPGMGVFKSTNGGGTWSQLNGPNAFNTATVHTMAMDPNSVNVIIAGTSDGLYRTSDGGNTWIPKYGGAYWKDVKFKPGDPSVVYAVYAGLFYRSTDGGINWSQVVLPITGDRIVIGVTAADPDYVYTTQTKLSPDKTFAGLMRSTDSGATFSTMSTAPNIYGYSCDGSDTSSQAYYDLCINVDPANKNIVYVGAINNWKSIDGGVNLNIISHWVGSSYGQPCAPSVHADQHALEWSPHNGKLYAGHDGGISWTGDGGASWVEITNNLEIAQVYKIGQSATNTELTLNGYQDNGSAIQDNGSFTTVVGGDGMECIIDYNNSIIRYVSGPRGKLRRSMGSGYSVIAAKDTNGITEKGSWVTPYKLHETDPNTMFAGYKNVWRSNNVKIVNPASVIWDAISIGETVHCDVLEQCSADPDILYVSRGSSLMRSDNANAVPAASVFWSACASPDTFSITDMETHLTDPNIVYATLGDNIYKSSDKGATWTDISGSLPDIDINCLVYDHDSDAGIYLGTQVGVWYKDNTLADWIEFKDGLPIVDVRELEIYVDSDPANSNLMAATYGRGLWESDLYVTTRQSFITTWKTDNPGTSNNTSITIPTFPGETYSYQVDWNNDGSFDTSTYTGNATHDYLTQDTVTIAIRGTFPRIFFDNGGDKEKILTVEQWGINRWTSMNNAFAGAVNLTSAGLDAPVLDSVTDMSGMFLGANLLNDDISAWDVSNVTNMSSLFNGAILFNAPIGSWDVGSVTKMGAMFHEAWNFNQDLNSWNVDSVTDMSSMFHAAYSFNGAISNWVVSQVSDMSSMFQEAYSFNQPINNWIVGNVRNMASMFQFANMFNADISDWNTGNVDNMYQMYSNASNFDADISDWDVSMVADMSAMFNYAYSFNRDLGDWDIGQVFSMENMLSNSGLSIAYYDSTLIGWESQSIPNITLGADGLTYCAGEAARDSLINNGWIISGDKLGCEFITLWNTANPGATNSTSIRITTYPGETYNYDVDWDNDGIFDQTGITGNVTYDFGSAGTYPIRIQGIFPGIYFNVPGADPRKILSIEQWGDIAWSRMDGAFAGCQNLTINATDIPDLSLVTDMSYMFNGATNLSGDLRNWDARNVTDMSYMFTLATGFNGDVSGWNVTSVTDMNNMFRTASSFNQDLSTWDVSSLTNMESIFHDATSFNGNVSNWDVSNVTNMHRVFYNAYAFNKDINSWIVTNVTDMSQMFLGAFAFNQNLSSWVVSNVTNMAEMFLAAHSFNGDVSGWSTGSVTNMDEMFKNAWAFNGNVSSWEVSNVTNLNGMFDGAGAFDQNLGNWNIGSVLHMNPMLRNTGLSVTNYDNTLIGWESQGVSGLNLSAGGLIYCNSVTERDSLIGQYGWTISGDTFDCSGLPIELISFEASNYDTDKVKLSWATLSELNSKGFELQKSNNGNDWVQMAFINSHGNSQDKLDYSYIDEHPFSGSNYYRLKHLDYDGTFDFSQIVFILMNDKISIYPNPTEGELKIIDARNSEITIYDSYGRTMSDLNPSNQKIDISILPAGCYFISIKNREENIIKQIIKN